MTDDMERAQKLCPKAVPSFQMKLAQAFRQAKSELAEGVEYALRERETAIHERDAALAEAVRLRQLLDAHHKHHLQIGIIGLPDGDGGWIEIDNAAEYCDSSLYEQTVNALEHQDTDTE